MSELLSKINTKKAEIADLETETETLRELMSEEIQEKTEKIQEIKQNIESLQEQLAHLRAEYNRGEAQIVSLQYSIETAKKSLKIHMTRRNELEIVNDNWETSIRTLEFYNSQLESQLQESEEFVLSLSAKIQNTANQSKEELSRLEVQNEEMKKIIKHKSRSSSPVPRPPISPKGSFLVAKLEGINIINRPVVEDSASVVVVAADNMFVNDRTVVIKDKGVKKAFEFNKVVKKSVFSEELKSFCDSFFVGKNCCLILSAYKTREQTFLSVIKKITQHLLGKPAEINCVEITKDSERNLLSSPWTTLTLNKDFESLSQTLFSQLTRGRSHLLLTLKIDFLYLQILDLGEVTEDQELSESLSINASLFYLEELMMNLSKSKAKFEKSALTRKLQLSLASNYFLQFFFQFEGINDVPVLSLAARLQAVFSRSSCKHEQNFRSLDLLEKERMANFQVLRVIEKAQKDLALLRREGKNKDLVLENLQMRMKGTVDRRQSLSPSLSPQYFKQSKIPLPKPVRKG